MEIVWLEFAARLLLLSLAYGLLDGLIRQEQLTLWLPRSPGGNPSAPVTAQNPGTAPNPAHPSPWPERAGWSLLCLALSLVSDWNQVPQLAVVFPLAVGLCTMLTWKVVTEDLDPATRTHNLSARFLLVGVCLSLWWSPALLPLALRLMTRPFILWRHHAILPIRALLATTAWLLLMPLTVRLPDPIHPYMPDISTLIFFLLTLHSSHYLTPGISKAQSGKHWYSWMQEARIHYLTANAYAWGWMAFLPWPVWRGVVKGVKRVEHPLQIVSFLVEIGAPLALLSHELALAFCLCWSLFHLGVFALSSIWFWDWVGANGLLALAIVRLPETFSPFVFGLGPALVSLLFILLLPQKNRLWSAIPLSWWETPFTQRVTWQVHGESGRVYALTADFMCPYERLYAKINAFFLAPVPLLTFYLGTVWETRHRDAVTEAGPDPVKLDEVRQRFGVQPRSERLEALHINFIQHFFAALNRGARKHFLPSWLLWFKAPGSHYNYYGPLPAYRRQEPVKAVTLHFREVFFDGESLVELRNELIRRIEIPAQDFATPCEPEPTAQDIERALSAAFSERCPPQ